MPTKIAKNMTKLSVNINKIATLRNSRGGDIPNVVEAALNAERFGAQGITVLPRPDERHIRYRDVYDLKPVLTTEFNIEGNPIDRFVDLVLDVRPTQVTLVPDAHNAITSNAGWDTVTHKAFLKEVIARFKASGIRTSIFVDARPEMIPAAAEAGADRVELYTEPYAKNYAADREAARCGLGVNGGHDLNLENLKYFAENIPNLLEVSIGHALVADAIYLGFENTIQLYLKQLR